jgi:hypothetical protein
MLRVETKPHTATARSSLRWWPLLALVMQDWAWGFADAWTTPHPWRRNALLEGRPFEYKDKSFLQRFSYRSLSDRPTAIEDGLRGTVGSLTSKQALSEIRFRKRFPFDRSPYAFDLAMQRGEDFDGYYNRQLVGFSRRLTTNWSVRIRGDVAGDKAASDVYLQTRWQAGPDRLAEAAVIAPDAYFNDKTPQSIAYEKRPWTFFGRARVPLSNQLALATSINYSPRAVVNDQRRRGVLAGGRSTRASSSLTWTGPNWRGRFTARWENTERDFAFAGSTGPATSEFRRIYHQVGMTLTRHSHDLKPTVGVQHFYLDEEGFFGAATNSRGRLHRNEPLLQASLRIDTGPHHYLRPELLVSRPDFRQTVTSDRWRDRDVRRWLAKINLPWRQQVHRDSGAVLTIAPSLELHDPGFGGGNVQLHWPL